MNHYEVLGVARTASTAELRSAYRKVVRQVHPDQGGNATRFHAVQAAWETLSDPERRAAYDRTLAPPAPPRAKVSREKVWVVPQLRRFTVIAPVALVCWLLFAVVPFWYTLSVGWFAFVVAGLMVVGTLGKSWSRARELDRAIGARAAYEIKVWGDPGEYRRTAELLEPVVLQLPAVKLIHGSRIRGIPTEHLLLVDRRLAVISSTPGTELALLRAVVAWRARGIDSRGFFVSLTGEPLPAVPGLTYLTAATAAPQLIGWLQEVGNVVDRRVLYDVLYRAPRNLRRAA